MIELKETCNEYTSAYPLLIGINNEVKLKEDYCWQNGGEGEFAVDSFNLLYARYLAMLHLSRIHSEVIPTMASYTKRCMVETPCEFWFLSMAIIIVATLSLVLIYKYFEWNSQWIKSASLIIRCAMFDDNELIRSVLNILEREHPNYIDDFPFPVFQ